MVAGGRCFALVRGHDGVFGTHTLPTALLVLAAAVSGTAGSLMRRGQAMRRGIEVIHRQVMAMRMTIAIATMARTAKT